MASLPDASLEAGLAALKQGNYESAIAHLEGVCETELDQTLVERAQVSLVSAYQKVNEFQKAIALCTQLSHSPNPKVSTWASRLLPDLTQQNTTSDTGFVAFDSSPAKKKPKHLPKSPTAKVPSKPEPAIESDSEASKRSTDRLNPSVALIPGNNIHPIASDRQSQRKISWRYAERAADRWKPLKPLKLTQLWLVEIGTCIALFWVVRFVIQWAMIGTNKLLVQTPFFEPIQAFYYDPGQPILIVLIGLLLASPWLLDGLLRFHNLKPLPLTYLASRSPEAAKVIQRFCRSRRLPLPKVSILPLKAPVMLTYGNLPHTARIVVSQGLLEQLTEGEIAVLYASQLGQIVHWDFIIMSLGATLLQLPYTLYWLIAQAGERLKGRVENPILRSFASFVATALASLCYGIYWVWRLPMLWLSRLRLYYSDRLAVETTGNPNGLTRALLKIAVGIATDIEHQKSTRWLLESFDILMPVGHRQALTLGSIKGQLEELQDLGDIETIQSPFTSILQWDCTNPYRRWLIQSYAHPLMGDRLQVLSYYAKYWKLNTELDLPPIATHPRDKGAVFVSQLQNNYKALPLVPSAALYGVVIGVVLRCFLWIIGQIADRLNIWQLIWLHNAQPFLNGCILMGFSLAIAIHLNRYFPDIKSTNLLKNPNLNKLLASPDTLPPDSQPIRLTGKLLGRKGCYNVGQDLILQTSNGAIKLNYISRAGRFGNLFVTQLRELSDRLGTSEADRQVIVTGWFRRGVTPWIDLETLTTQTGKITIKAGYPVWVAILAALSTIWGAWTIWQA